MTIHRCYKAVMGVVFDTPDGKRERHVEALYTAEDIREALCDGGAWAEKHFRDWCEGESFGSLKIYEYKIGPMTDDFRCANTGVVGFSNFEWKYDWGVSLGDHLRAALKKHSKEVV